MASVSALLPPEADPRSPVKRRELIDHLETSVVSAIATNALVGLVIIDLTNLAEINRRSGYAWGNQLLERVETHLNAQLPTYARLFRSGGQSFAAVLPALNTPAQIVLAVSQIRQQALEALNDMTTADSTRISVGAAVQSEACSSAEKLLMLAELRMEESRGGAAFQPERFLEAFDFATADDALLPDFEMALANNAFELHYQPKVRLDNLQPMGMEAVLR